jgi:hypothetical protein
MWTPRKINRGIFGRGSSDGKIFCLGRSSRKLVRLLCGRKLDVDLTTIAIENDLFMLITPRRPRGTSGVLRLVDRGGWVKSGPCG